MKIVGCKEVRHMEREEWEIIYETYYKPLYLYALSLTGNRLDTEDLVQEAFVKAFLSYRKIGSLKYWLVTVLRNEFLNLQRKRKKELLNDGTLFAGCQNDEKEALLERVIENENRRLLFDAIQKLPLVMKEVLMESVYFHMSDAEIAKLHGMTDVNVRKIRSRAKQKLLEVFDGRSGGYGKVE